MLAIGIVAFAAVATVRHGRPIPTTAVVVLTGLVTAWLFASTLIWGTPYPTKIRWASAWIHHTGAWQWTVLLTVSYIGVLAVAASLRSFSQNRPKSGWTFVTLAFVSFTGWSAVVSFSVVVAAIAAGTGLAALSAGAPAVRAEALTVRPSSTGAPRPKPARIPIAIAATVAVLAIVSIALLSMVPQT
jgi:hypothetical protein